MSSVIGAIAATALVATPAWAQDKDAEALFKALSDFLVAQQTMSVNYDATLEIVTADMEKVGLASSGSLNMSRPDRVRMTRTGGLANVEFVFDGQTFSAYGKNLNVFAKLPIDGTIDDLIDMLRLEFGLELPAADLLSANPYEIMMSNVTDVKGLGTGVIRGQDCDHLAFRTSDVDWQIWISEGDKPLPCRFTITSKTAAFAPTYSIEFSDWKTGADVVVDDFKLSVDADAREIGLDELHSLSEIPEVSGQGDAQ